jgi:hypothetical protein
MRLRNRMCPFCNVRMSLFGLGEWGLDAVLAMSSEQRPRLRSQDLGPDYRKPKDPQRTHNLANVIRALAFQVDVGIAA